MEKQPVTIYVVTDSTLTKVITELSNAVSESYLVDNSTLNRQDIVNIIYDVFERNKTTILV